MIKVGDQLTAILSGGRVAHVTVAMITAKFAWTTGRDVSGVTVEPALELRRATRTEGIAWMHGHLDPSSDQVLAMLAACALRK